MYKWILLRWPGKSRGTFNTKVFHWSQIYEFMVLHFRSLAVFTGRRFERHPLASASSLAYIKVTVYSSSLFCRSPTGKTFKGIWTCSFETAGTLLGLPMSSLEIITVGASRKLLHFVFRKKWYHNRRPQNCFQGLDAKICDYVEKNKNIGQNARM